MSCVSYGKSLAKRRRPHRHRALDGPSRNGDCSLRMRSSQRRFEFRQVVAQLQEGESPGGAADLMRLGCEVSVCRRFAADRIKQVGDAGRQRIGEFKGSGGTDGGSDLLQAIGANLRGHCKILSGGQSPRSL
jgi:hypothetical protein